MTNQLTQAELIDLAKQAGFKETRWSDILGVKVESLAKFAQLIQQREADNRQDEPAAYQFKGRDGEWKNFMNQAHYANTRDSGEWEIRALYTQPQTVKQALEKAAAIAMNAPITANMMDSDAAKAVSFHASAHIRALIDQPVEQGGDELVEALETIAGYPLTRDQEMGVAAMRKIARQALANRRGGE